MKNTGAGINTGQTSDTTRSVFVSPPTSGTLQTTSGGSQPELAFHGVRTQPADPATGIASCDESTSSLCCSSSLTESREVKAFTKPPFTPAEYAWQRLLDEYSNKGVLVRTHDTPESQIKDLFSGDAVSASWLLPGNPVRLFVRTTKPVEETPPGIIFSANCEKIARFKKNAATFDIKHYGSYDRLPKDYGIQGSASEKKHKNHRNDYSFLTKTKELDLKCRKYNLDNLYGPSGTPYYNSSGHISRKGNYIPGKQKLWKSQSNPAKTNEIVIEWSKSNNKILGIMLQHPVYHEKIKLAIAAIKSTLIFFPDKKKYISSLPLVEYTPKYTRLRYLGSVDAMMKYSFDSPKIVKQNINADTLYQTLNGKPYTITHLLDESRFPDNIQRLSDAIRVNLNIITVINYKSLLIYSCYRQMLENCGYNFTNEEALLLGYAVALRTGIHPTISRSARLVFEWFGERMRVSNVPESLSETICYALNRSCGQYRPPSPKVILFGTIIESAAFTTQKFQQVDGIFPDWPNKKWREFISDLQIIKKTITELTISSLILAREPSWTLMLEEISMITPSMVVKILKHNNEHGTTQGWAVSEIMLSSLSSSRKIYETCSLLDQIQACVNPHLNKFISTQVEHFRQRGLPIFPGTICSDSISDRCKVAIERELRKQPTDAVIHSIKSAFTAISRPWEKVHYPVWDHCPLEGMKNVPLLSTMQAPRECVIFTALQPAEGRLLSQLRQRERLDIPEGWNCSICIEDRDDRTQSVFIELKCTHFLHQACVQNLISSNALKCPECRKELFSFQPPCMMEWSITAEECAGENAAGCIALTYNIESGKYKDGTAVIHYPGSSIKAFLPNHEKGRQAVSLLKTAFEQGSALTVECPTTNKRDNTVVFNDIPLKTKLHGSRGGYPAPGFVDELIDILKKIDDSESGLESWLQTDSMAGYL